MMEGFYMGDTGIYARLYRPDGPDLCPLVVIFHGFPGNEQNSDIAYALREEGFAVLTPYYNGCWGSKGSYRIENVPENVRSVLAFARSPEWAGPRGIDHTNIGVVGHSLGGWAALISPRIDSRLKAVVSLDPLVEPAALDQVTDGQRDAYRAWLSESASSLSDVTVDQLVAGFNWAAHEWHPIAAMDHLGETPLMLIAASGPDAIPLDAALSLISRARSVNPAVELWVLNSDHSFVSERPLLRDLVVRYIRRTML